MQIYRAFYHSLVINRSYTNQQSDKNRSNSFGQLVTCWIRTKNDLLLNDKIEPRSVVTYSYMDTIRARL